MNRTTTSLRGHGSRPRPPRSAAPARSRTEAGGDGSEAFAAAATPPILFADSGTAAMVVRVLIFLAGGSADRALPLAGPGATALWNDGTPPRCPTGHAAGAT